MASMSVTHGDSVIAFVCPLCPGVEFKTFGEQIEHQATVHEEGKWRT